MVVDYRNGVLRVMGAVTIAELALCMSKRVVDDGSWVNPQWSDDKELQRRSRVRRGV